MEQERYPLYIGICLLFGIVGVWSLEPIMKIFATVLLTCGMLFMVRYIMFITGG